MYRYLACGLIAAGSTAMSSTLSNKLLIGKIPNEYYLGKDIPGTIISLSLSLLLAHRFKAKPMILGVVTSSLYPLGVYADVMASRSDHPVYYLTIGSILRNISYVGPAGAHTTAIIKICHTNNANIFGTRNMVLGSIGATTGIITGIYYEVQPVLVALIYPISLYFGWRKLL